MTFFKQITAALLGAVLILFSLSAVSASVDSELVTLAKYHQTQTQGLSEVRVTRLLHNVDIQVGARSVTHTVTSIWYYPSLNTIQDAGYDTIYFNGFTQNVRDLSSFTVSPSGELAWFNVDDARVLESDTYNVFSDGKKKVINHVGLQSQSISVLRYTIETDLTKLEVPWSQLVYVQSYSDQKQVNISVEGLSQLPVFAQTSSDLITCETFQDRISCTGRDIPRLDSGDNFYFSDEAAHVALSSVEDWDSIITTMLDAYSVARSSNQSVIQQLPRIISDEMSNEEKISAIHHHVAREIRYLSESEAGNAYIPHSVSRTIDKKYGDCKDKTVLLLEMFEQAGIEAYPVLISTRRKATDKLLVPSAAYFNHVIMCFNYAQQDYCIDATDSTSDWRYMSQWVQGHVALPLVPGATVQNAMEEPHAYAIKNEIDIEILPNGGQLEKQRIEFHGAYASSYRSSLEGQETQEQVEYMVELYQDVVSDGTQPKVEITGVQNLQDAITVMTEYEYAPYLDMEDDISVIDYEPWINFELNSYNAQNTIYDLDFAGSKVISTVNVRLPEHWDVKSYPATLALSSPFATLNRTVSEKAPGQFTLVTEFALSATSISVQEYQQFESTIEAFKQEGVIRFTARKQK
ncbi:transglutaminase-like domain-containing protein [Glaciecola sp. XM2]|uniref:transglutaminase-like domain-containing protein n=1 Tax=Glaciecola sp. XM2 TaxID=1914931 RepID=UPI001BDF571E|nr:transglutaminase-like domain-containing protein [Glaciecola sp. XM2]MBT1451557.1 transglutaminase-like domain-containing protein [Glaciecola sp. XM2]